MRGRIADHAYFLKHVLDALHGTILLSYVESAK